MLGNPGITHVQSLRNALGELLEADARVILVGEDLVDPYGGAFGVTRGLSTLYPGRVVASPISEAAIVGVGVGLALKGFRPIVEIMFGDFITLAADQLINVAAKVEGMYGGHALAPVVVRTPMGGGRGYGPTHSQTLDKVILGTPGIRVIAPSLFHDSGALLKSAVQADTGPVLFSEHKLLYGMGISDNVDGNQIQELPGLGGYHTIVVRNYDRGVPDVGVVAYGGASRILAKVMVDLAAEEIRVKAVLPASVQPVPENDLMDALSDVRAVLVLEEGTADFGWGAEIAARLAAGLWPKLRAPIARIGARNNVIPAAIGLEAATLPNARGIRDGILELVHCSQ